MTMPRYYALVEYWKNCPPTHVSVAAFIGVKPQNKTAPAPLDFEDYTE